MGEKSPHWIYPTNRFVLLDGESITVLRGDTLWDIARSKLIEMDINFNKTLKKLRNNEYDSKDEAIGDLKKYSFSRKHGRIIGDIQGADETR